MNHPTEATANPALDRLAAADRSARICSAATWTIQRLNRTREDFASIFDWARSEAPQDRAGAAAAERSRFLDGELLAIEEALGDPLLLGGAAAQAAAIGPFEGSVLARLAAARPHLLNASDPVDVSATVAGAFPILDAAELRLDAALGRYERLVAVDLPALERVLGELGARSRGEQLSAAITAGTPGIAACVCTFPCGPAPYTGPTSVRFNSGSGGARFTIKVAGAKARRVNVKCTVRTNARRGRFQVYVSSDSNLSLVTPTGPFAVEGPGPTTFQVFGCIGGFGDSGFFRIYDLVSSPGVIYEVTVVNN